MRTSRASKDTAKVLQALSPPGRRQTRSASGANVLREFAYNGGTTAEPEAPSSDDDVSSLSSVATVDMEDILEPPAKRRKSKLASVATRTGSRSAATRQAPERLIEKSVNNEPVSPKAQKAPRKVPARKIKDEDGSYKVEPPSNWETIYDTVKKMREENPTAPVDTMGCAELYWRASAPRERRFQTLIALMLSSQTKDTVTAVAMQRLHTELGEAPEAAKQEPVIKQESPPPEQTTKDSTLNLENILAVAPERLNQLIGTVGFHNNKTKYIKAAALILRDQYDGDIPSTAPELMKLPGVGPKMAFLCMSAAWGKHEGIGVDVHVHRITNLWGWHKTKNPEETRMSLESWLPKEKWHEINKLLVGLGQTVCLPVGRKCGDCDLAGTKLCKSEVKGLETTPPRPTITFLHLPEHVRIIILQYAGLLRPCLVNISFEKDRIKRAITQSCSSSPMRETRGHWTTTVDRPCDHPRLPLGLLASSRSMRDELGPLFFRLNRFSAFLHTKADFKTFRVATAWGIHNLKSLHLDLGPRENRNLKLDGTGAHRTAFAVWKDFCKIAAQKMTGLRDFSLRCRVREDEVACRLMRDAYPFPKLSRCAIHFNNIQDDDIRPILKRAVWRLTDNLGHRPSFPFHRLPKEVQYMILEYVLIDRSDPYIPTAEWSRGIVTFQERRRPRVNVFPLTCCGTCSPLQTMCFCHSRQTSYSSTCSCFTSPLPYFLVNREFYHDASRIFYSRNIFAFVEEDPEFMMRFLHSISDSTFKLIRHLTFKFPALYRHPSKCAHRPEDSALVSWAVLRRFIREHFAVPLLSITIIDLGTKNYVNNVSPNRNKYLRKLLKSFEDLQSLRDFRVFLADDGIFEIQAETAVLGGVATRREKARSLPFIGKRHLTRRG
ncbi:hypothetical protein P170DRAFT_419214 [Aspergillus steynii IBT 23096]|uniref:Endonuclease III homolog n=1 Tax=Aspergillus steynii IBT 23096 TaxID=1392250 RepID=A0A2I2FRR3_9EURO|nr:uncharacterized protein P170DRAFT_419214 [Aspergillus steynii IBT 23096]PLB43322.1 hypothetical protein P170DRAFT_419214 [Aspergillus steynii IBT 23096]